MTLHEAFRDVPLIAILRGVRPQEIEPIVAVLLDAGFRVVEVPLNSPDPLASIGAIARRFGDQMIVGAGTVLTPEDALEVIGAGGRMLVAPNFEPAVGAVASRHDALWIPGVFTPTEAFAALAAGADALKLFPAEAIAPAVVKAMRAVLPPQALLLPVGGIVPERMADYLRAGANGFGLGSALYAPGFSAAEVGSRAERFVQALANRPPPSSPGG